MIYRFLGLYFTMFCLSYTAFAQGESPTQGGEDSIRLEEQKTELPKKGEKFLTIEKPGAVKRIRFYKGQQLEFKLKGSKIKYKARIQDVKENSIVIRDTDIPLSDFHSITVYPHKPFLRTLSRLFFIGGIGYTLLDLANNSFEPNAVTGIVAGTGLGLGLIFRIPLKRTFKLGKKRYLKTLETF